MSKSIGNVVDPKDIIKEHGSDVLRLWAVSSNFKVDVTIGPDIVKQIAEAKRKIRNTLRFIVGNLEGFNGELSTLPLNTIDKLMITKLKQFDEYCENSIVAYDFPLLFQTIIKFCTTDLSSFYFEILKDRLYTEPTDSPIRQSGQFVLSCILNVLLKHLSPIAPILVEEIKESHIKSFKISHFDNFAVDLNRLENIREVRGRFLEWFNRTGKSEMKAKSTFQLDLKIEVKDDFWSSADLQEIFMVASVILEINPSLSSELSVVNVARSERSKCPRCWTFNSNSEEDLCFKCNQQLGLNELTKDLKSHNCN